jgi:hypothetical protein
MPTPQLAHHGPDVGSDHDELAVRHVDDAGHAEDDRQAQAGDDQNRDDTEAA